jgi:uncharacterized protein (DUF2267 family)
MDYTDFTDAVAKRGHLEREQAERAVAATLTTLSQRLTPGEANDLAGQLPRELKSPFMGERAEAETFGADEFVRRVAEAAEMDDEEARQAVGAVLTTLRDAVAPEQLDDVLAQLPRDFEPLFAERA